MSELLVFGYLRELFDKDAIFDADIPVICRLYLQDSEGNHNQVVFVNDDRILFVNATHKYEQINEP